jgi:hypothetical protein
MGAEPAPGGRHLCFSGASQLAPAANRAVHLQIYADVPGGHSDFIVGNGQKAPADHTDETADPLSDVLVLRAVRETAQIYAHGRSRISGKDRRSIGREASSGRESSTQRSPATIGIAGRAYALAPGK